jgi:hypothetical protein
VRALLDQHGRCGGLLMAGADHSLDGWQEKLPSVRLPRLQWRGTKSWCLFAVAAAFVALGFLVPQSLASLGGSRLDVTREVERLKAQLEVLEKEKLIDRERAEALKIKLDDLRRDASGKDPVKTMEALDHVQDVAKQAAQEAAEKASRKMEEMARAAALAEALDRNGSRLDAAELTEALNQLAALARKAALENDLLEESLDQDLIDALKKGKLTKEQLKKLAKALEEGKGKMAEQVSKLVKAKLIDADALAKCDECGKCDNAALALYLKENGFKSETADELTEMGNGGVDRGPGEAKLTFGDESTEDGVKYKEEELPAARQQALRESQLSGVSKGSPSSGKDKRQAGSTGALDGAKSGGGSAMTQVVLPRHKAAVERYFDRPTQPKK